MEKLISLIKKYWIVVVAILVIVLGVLVVVTTTAQKKYTIQTDISTGQQLEYETKVMELDKQIKEFIAAMPSQKDDTTDGNAELENLPNESWFVEKALNLSYLWRYGEAIDTINELFNRYDESVLWRDALAKLYKGMGEYEKSIDFYQKIIDLYGDEWGEYSKKIAKVYVDMGNGQMAWEWYVKYESNGWERNESLINEIKNLNK